MEINYKLVGQRMQQLRKANNITQEQIADSLNTTVAFISNIENNRTKMNLRVLTYYASVLNVSVDYLLHAGMEDSDDSADELDTEILHLLHQCDSSTKEKIIRCLRIIIND